MLNLPAFENKEYTAYDYSGANSLYGEILTKQEPVRMLRFPSRLPCHIIINDVLHLMQNHA